MSTPTGPVEPSGKSPATSGSASPPGDKKPGLAGTKSALAKGPGGIAPGAGKVAGATRAATGVKAAAGSAQGAVAKAKSLTGGTDLGADATAADKAKSVGKDVATEAVKGAVTGAGGGWAGAGIGAAKGVGKAVAGNKHARNGIIAAIAALVLFPVVAMLMTVMLVASVSGTKEATNEQATVKAMTDTGKDEAFVIEARDVVKGSTIPWQIAAAVKHVNKADLDAVELEKAMHKVDPNSQYQNMEAGTVYSSSSPTRLLGTGQNAEDAKKVKETWTAAIVVGVAVTEKVAARIYDIALTWYLGQSFGSCDFLDDPVEEAGGKTLQFDDEQSDSAKRIIGLAKSAFSTRGAASRAAEAALVAAIQLSDLRNNKGDPAVDDATELTGLFAQPYALVGDPVVDQDGNTGTVMTDKRTNVSYTVGKFYENLNAVAGWQDLSPGEAAEAVLGSEKRGNYFPWEAFAIQTLKTNYGSVPVVALPALIDFEPIEKEDTPLEDGSEVACAAPGQNYLGTVILPLGDSPYSITGNYGMRLIPLYGYWRMHAGLDFAKGCGTPIYSVEDGIVTLANASASKKGFGTHVEIQHADGFMSTYSHMIVTSLQVKFGDKVSAGQQIGSMGTTGSSTGCHLHFETFIDGKHLDPRIAMKMRGLDIKP